MQWRWRKVVVYRDPLERFLSAHGDKCLEARVGMSKAIKGVRAGPARNDASKHCFKVFNLTREEGASPLAVARRLAANAHDNGRRLRHSLDANWPW